MPIRVPGLALGTILLALSLLIAPARAASPPEQPFTRAAARSAGAQMDTGNAYGGWPNISNPAADNPIPTITDVSPSFAELGTHSLTIAIAGSGFTNTSTAQWWSANLPTTFVDSAHLRAEVGAELLPAGTPGYVTVANPAPGGGRSNQVAVDVGIRYAGSIGGGVPTVAISGTLAYVGEGSEFVVLDVGNPAAPARLGSYTTRETVQDVEVVGTRAYVTADHDGLLILDVHDPAHPARLGGYNTPGHAYDVQVVGGIAYVAAEYGGLQIVDVSNPAAPHLLGQYSITAYDLSVANGVVYIATGDSYNQFVSVDVHDPTHPTLRDNYGFDPNFGLSTGVQVVGNLAYIASSRSLIVVDVTTPRIGYPPYYVAYELPHQVKDVFVAGNRAYVTSYYGDLYIFDVSDPQHPQLLFDYDTPGNSWDVRVVGSRAYVADGLRGLLVLNVANPQAPAKLGSYDTWSAYQQTIVGSRAYVAGGVTGLQILDVSDLAHPRRLGGVASLGYTSNVQVVGDLAYIANMSVWGGSGYVGGGLQIVNISNPAVPALVVAYPLDSADVQVIGDRAYVAAYYGAKPGGLVVLDVADPAHPHQLGATSTPINALKVRVSGQVAYLIDWDGLYAIDLSNLANLKQLGSYPYPLSLAYDMQVVGDVVYLASRSGGLYILNAHDPAHISKLGGYQDYYLEQCGLQVIGTRAYIVGVDDNDGDLLILDISNPAAPTLLLDRQLSGHALKVQVVGNLIYIASEQDGLQILRLSTNTTFVPMLHR